MLDAWTEIGRNPLTRVMFKRMGLRTPPQLLRAFRPWSDDLLLGKQLLLNQGGNYNRALAAALLSQKAQVHFSPEEATELSQETNTSAGVTGMRQVSAFQGTLFDATHFQNAGQLKLLFTFFQAQLRKLGFSHRIVILFRSWPAEAAPEAHATARAIEGFVRGLAKELGPKGAMVNAIRVPEQAQSMERLVPLVGFLLSDHCSFVTGQLIDLNLSARGGELPELAGSLAGKRALVTGAAQGIGYAISRRLAEEGAHVICLDRPQNRQALKDLSRSIEGEMIEADLALDIDLHGLGETLQNSPAPLDILVHNAGITRDRSLFAMEESQWDAVLRINLEAPLALTQEILHRGLMAKGGRIICMSSIVGLAGNYGQTNYGTAKAGLIGFIEGLAKHVALQGITSNAVAPGFIETPMTAHIPFLAKQFARRLASLGQGGQPDDVAEMVCFLASPCSQGINGSVLRVCGGNFLGS